MPEEDLHAPQADHAKEVLNVGVIPTVSGKIAWLRQGQMLTPIFSHAAARSGLRAD
jgi:hypothetical protein